jgi:hypothetical protein
MNTNKPKFDYNSKEFYDSIEQLAMKGMTDRHIARALVVDFGESLNPTYFSELKNEKDENGELTERAKGISEALARGREKINLLVRDTYLKTALGGKKTKDIVRSYAEWKCDCKGKDINCPNCFGTGKIVSESKAVIQEVEREMQPNIQALSVWLFNHDEEWKQAVIEGKKLDITSKGEQINQITVFELPDNGRNENSQN